MHVLVATDSVHTTAQVCDYLDGRITPEDTVTVVAVVSPEDSLARRDGEEALNVARVRLVGGAVETELREAADGPADEILETAEEHDVDELVVAAHDAPPNGAGGLGSTAATLLAETKRPVVVVPHSSP